MFTKASYSVVGNFCKRFFFTLYILHLSCSNILTCTKLIVNLKCFFNDINSIFLPESKSLQR